MINFFNPHDFATSLEYSDVVSWADAAAIANRKLEGSSVKVFGAAAFGHPNYWRTKRDVEHTKDTHIGLLINVRKLELNCKHEPTEWDVHWKNIICKHCGVELQATWSEK